jgi:uncharacterized membrane-anchored protein
MKLSPSLCVIAVALAAAPLHSATPDSTDPAAKLSEYRRLASLLHYQSGDVVLRGGIAKVSLPYNFEYLNPEDTDTVLSKIWGNPSEKDFLGMIVPAGFDPLKEGNWAVILSYADDGYVKDDEASKIDYVDLLKKMKEGTAEANKARAEKGYPPIELVGWAATPRYDAAEHKLYWAKEAKFGGMTEDTLNYNIRILGRSGVLVLNVVAGMRELPEVEKATPTLLAMVDFQPGHRYADFKQGTDKVATYGIAALVAGGIAAKVGLFKGLWVAILALKKFIILAALAVARYAKKIWNSIRGRSSKEEPPSPPAPPAEQLEPPAGSA